MASGSNYSGNFYAYILHDYNNEEFVFYFELEGISYSSKELNVIEADFNKLDII
jgi:hypothetical protein